MIPAVSIVGFSNTGKTSLVERLIRVFKERGYRVAAVKHAAHGYEIDVPGKDTWQYYQAGAERVVVVGPASLTIHERYQATPPLKEICKRLNDIDLIIVEGFKREPGPKIEVIRKNYSPRRISLGDDLIAVVSDFPHTDVVPCFSKGDAEPLADFLINHFALVPSRYLPGTGEKADTGSTG